VAFWSVSGDGNGDTRSMAAWCWLSARPAAISSSNSSGAMIAWAGARNRSSSSGCFIGMPVFCRIASAAPVRRAARRPSTRSAVAAARGPGRAGQRAVRPGWPGSRSERRGESSVGDRSSPPAARREPCSGELDQPLAVGRQSARSTVGGSARPGIAHLPRAHPSRYSRGRYMRSPRHANWPGDIPRRLRWFL
jgi:hypothetical protein